MKKFKVAAIAIIDGLLMVSALVAAILGLIHSVSTSAEYLLMVLAPAPAAWIHTKLNAICDRLNGLNK